MSGNVHRAWSFLTNHAQVLVCIAHEPEVRLREIGDQIEVLLDGGIRRGGDVAKSLALGAKAVMIGTR